MKNFRIIKIIFCVTTAFSFLIFFSSCNKEKIYANLTIDEIEFVETFHSKYLDLPFSFSPDNPNFDPNDPTTWTGNMAQYVRNSYNYSINYRLSNSGTEIAFDTEIDFIYTTESGKEMTETSKIGDVSPESTNKKSYTIYNIDEQIVECIGEVYWYDY